MPYSSSLTEEEWVLIEPLLTKEKKTCPTKWSKRQILGGVFYQLKNVRLMLKRLAIAQFFRDTKLVL